MTTTTPPSSTDDVLRAQAWEIRPGDRVSFPGLIPFPVLVEWAGPRNLDGEEFIEVNVWPESAAGPGVGMVSLTLVLAYPVAIHDRTRGF